MSREIKFRAFDKSNKKMYYKGFWVNCKYPNSDGDICFDPKVFKPGYYNALDIEVMQFTGLKDKNGKEIFEGNIIKGDYFLSDYYEFITGYVNYSEIDALFDVIKNSGLNYPMYRIDNSEIIGNIYENPELLTPLAPATNHVSTSTDGKE